VTSKKTQLDFELPPLDLAFSNPIGDISIAEIVSFNSIFVNICVDFLAICNHFSSYECMDFYCLTESNK